MKIVKTQQGQKEELIQAAIKELKNGANNDETMRALINYRSSKGYTYGNLDACRYLAKAKLNLLK